MLRLPTLTPSCATIALISTLLGVGCQPATFDDGGDSADAPSSQGDEADTGDDNGSNDDNSSSSGGDGTPVFNCDPGFEMDCPEGQKCTVLLEGNTPVYDCVNDDSSLLPFEACTVAPGTGQDQCPNNHACMPFEIGGSDGMCLELCEDDNDCDAAICSAAPGQLIPVCAAICDPLVPLCPEKQDCQRVRKTAFGCQFPDEGDVGITADPCDIGADRGCAEGFVCETGLIVTGCQAPSCCTALCDTSDTDPCEAPMSCNELPLEPQPGLENVGACYVPQ